MRKRKGLSIDLIESLLIKKFFHRKISLSFSIEDVKKNICILDFRYLFSFSICLKNSLSKIKKFNC